ncbi:Acyl-CoA synthetase (AMP-forming)/AMP-acid ligase II [Jannaschia faecimaris]|uniref:Acyl-CoA synthetase (AMP-forming)/AMP-acid ligase II n=1 Tax=Jannaschia faecimaris TaxID=1244108 RepID=A0A1H3RHH9_9RHOB|nr:AMP-binding protein [Jannaschia faecimaris]SDZ25137.1 Acyl-CoA synthetase (AMP-forming)/AMP-acid ligase II [Jannaschia faecimaris]
MTRIHHLIERAADRTPDAFAVRDVDGRAVTYAAHQRAIETAADLLVGAGFLPGDRLLVVAENCHATSVLIFAASRAGGVAVPVNARMTDAEMTRIVEHATPRLIACTTDISPEATRHAGAVGATPHATEFGTIALTPARPGLGEGATLETAVILYTTGTTGAPKGVMLTHGNLIFAGKTSAELRDIEAHDLIYGALPMTHVFGLASMLMAASTRGAAIQFEARFRPDRLYEALKAGATVFPGVPQMHALLMSYVAENGLDGLRDVPLHYVSSGGAPLDMAWKRKAEAFYGLALQNGYGMTETTAGICATKNPFGTPDVSCGPPLPGVEIMLDTAIGDSADATVGEVLTRGPHVMAGYYRNPEATAEVLGPDGWLRTGDLGRIDGDGFLHIVGRAKELIIRGGFNVYPPEVEAAFNDHPQVVQCAVIGRMLPGGDEEVLAFVQCADPDTLDLDALRAFAAARLTAYKRPARIIAAATLPAAPSGKILKHTLASVFADRLT